MTADEARIRVKQATIARADAKAEFEQAIRDAIEAGIGPTELAALTGLHRSRIYQIRDGTR